MAPTEKRPLYNFYFRYKWNEVDFANWQSTMIGILRDTIGSIFGPCLMNGGAVAPSGSTRAVTVAAYETINSDGYVGVRNSISLVPIATADPTHARKDLIVARPLIVDQDFITRPTSPFDSVPLQEGQDTQLVAIAGTPSVSPVYPSKVAGDVVIAGLNVAANATSFSSGNIDTSVTEVLSGNTNFSSWVVGKDVHGDVTISPPAQGVIGTSLRVVGAGNDKAISAVGGSGNVAADFTGGTDGDGVTVQGNGIGRGLVAVGGATDGDGIVGTSGGGDGRGVVGTGTGIGAGVFGQGGPSGGPGLYGSTQNASGIGAYVDQAGGGRGLQIAPLGSPVKAPFSLGGSAQPTGPNAVGDMYMTTAGVLKVCTVAGTPGTWVSVGTQT